MEFETLVSRRKMVRSFLEEDIPDNDIEEVLRVALRGPSAGFAQGVEFVVARSQTAREHFWSCATTARWLEDSKSHYGLSEAKAVLVVLVSKDRYIKRYQASDKVYSTWRSEESWPVPYWYFDAGAAVMLALLTATNLGLGALFFAIDRGWDDLRAFFGIPEELSFVGAIALGRPARSDRSGSSKTLARRTFEDSVKIF